MSDSRHKTSVSDAAKLFAGSRLTLARNLAGIRKNELAERIGKTPTAVASYESGRTNPSAPTVAQLCVALGVEASFFLPTSGTARKAPGIVTPHFRSLRSTTQIARDQATAYGLMVEDTIDVFDRHVEMPAMHLPRDLPPIKTDDPRYPVEMARSLREAWQLGDGPIDHILRTAENRGVLCVFSPFAIASVDAYSFERRVRPVVILNPLKGDYYRQRFDVAHEVGHLMMHADAEPGSHIIEREADRFAAEFLTPGDIIRSQLPHRPLWNRLQELKEYWGISIQALLYRARDLGIYNDTTYRNSMARMSKFGWRRQEPGARPTVEQPSILPRSLALLEDVGIFSLELAAEAHVPMKIFRTITARSIDSIAMDEKLLLGSVDTQLADSGQLSLSLT